MECPVQSTPAMRWLVLALLALPACTNVEDDILPPDAAMHDGPVDAPIDVHSTEEPPCFQFCDAGTPDAGID